MEKPVQISSHCFLPLFLNSVHANWTSCVGTPRYFHTVQSWPQSLIVENQLSTHFATWWLIRTAPHLYSELARTKRLLTPVSHCFCEVIAFPSQHPINNTRVHGRINEHKYTQPHLLLSYHGCNVGPRTAQTLAQIDSLVQNCSNVISIVNAFKIYRIMQELPWVRTFGSRVKRFANNVSEWWCHDQKSLTNRITSDPKVVIHGNEWIVLFPICYFMSWTHNSTKNNYRLLISPLSLRTVFYDLVFIA